MGWVDCGAEKNVYLCGRETTASSLCFASLRDSLFARDYAFASSHLGNRCKHHCSRFVVGCRQNIGATVEMAVACEMNCWT